MQAAITADFLDSLVGQENGIIMSEGNSKNVLELFEGKHSDLEAVTLDQISWVMYS